MTAPHRPAAFINAIADEGSKNEAIEWLQKTWNEHIRLVEAVEALYFAGHWHADREVNEIGLWTAVRDAAGIKPGQTGERLGPDRTRPEAGAIERENRELRKGWLELRQRELRRDGMKIEQARIHADVELVSAINAIHAAREPQSKG